MAARRLLQALAVMALTLVALELALQIAGLVAARRHADHRASPVSRGEIVVLCAGDSHTFGAGLPTQESYPAQLEQRLNAQPGGRRFRVLNLGVPGANTAYVANRLERWILELRPDVVIVWAGINNSWNAAETGAWGDADTGVTLRRWLLHSRLFRVAAVAWHTRSAAPDRARGAEEWYQGADAEEIASQWGDAPGRALVTRGTAFDVERMASTARALRTPLLLMDYPYPKTSEHLGTLLRSVAEPLGVPVVPTLEARDRAHADGHEKDDLIFLGAGVHPTGILYGYIAEALVPYVTAALEIRDRVRP